MMQEQSQDDWRAPWSAARPMTIDYSFSGASSVWRKAPRGNFECRDLGLAEASRGSMAAQHRRAIGKQGAAHGEWQCHDMDFQFFYVFKGSLTIENELSGRHKLGAGGVGLHGRFLRYAEIEVSDDFEIIEIGAPANAATILGRDAPPPPHGTPIAAARRAQYLHETPKSYAVGAGPRRYFAYRDLGTADFTRRRIHIHVVKALDPMPGGTGWHNHTMSQLFVVLQGWAKVAVEGRSERTMNAGDAMCLRAGMRHDVPAYSADYKVLEMCIPADYDTTATEAPAA